MSYQICVQVPSQAFHSAVKKFEENETAGVKGAAKVPLQGRGTASPWGLGGDAP